MFQTLNSPSLKRMGTSLQEPCSGIEAPMTTPFGLEYKRVDDAETAGQTDRGPLGEGMSTPAQRIPT